MELTGLAVSAAQTEKIKALCDALDDYDKKAIDVRLRPQQPRLRGRFCSQKRTGHTTKEQMRRLCLKIDLHLYILIVNCFCTTDVFSLGSLCH